MSLKVNPELFFSTCDILCFIAFTVCRFQFKQVNNNGHIRIAQRGLNIYDSLILWFFIRILYLHAGVVGTVLKLFSGSF